MEELLRLMEVERTKTELAASAILDAIENQLTITFPARVKSWAIDQPLVTKRIAARLPQLKQQADEVPARVRERIGVDALWRHRAAHVPDLTKHYKDDYRRYEGSGPPVIAFPLTQALTELAGALSTSFEYRRDEAPVEVDWNPLRPLLETYAVAYAAFVTAKHAYTKAAAAAARAEATVLWDDA